MDNAQTLFAMPGVGFIGMLIIGIIAGYIAEIGVFEGRLLIAMALSLADGERALAIDPFTWPDLGLRGRFEANCVAHGVPAERLAVLQRDSRSVTPRQLLNAAGGGIVRFLHIDGEHTAGHLASDLRLAAAAAAPDAAARSRSRHVPRVQSRRARREAFDSAWRTTGRASPPTCGHASSSRSSRPRMSARARDWACR